jgi:phage shock protein A
MGIFDKLKNLTKANLNNLINQLEDPKKMAEQAVLDLEENKKKALGLLIKAQGSTKLLEQKMLNLRASASELLTLAENALKKADEDEARKVLERKQKITEEKQYYEAELLEQQKTIEVIKRGLKTIDEKIGELKLSAKDIAQTTINKTDAFDNFARMEEKIEMSEHEMAALNELLTSEEAKKPETLISFDKHSDPEALEKELLSLKKKIG